MGGAATRMLNAVKGLHKLGHRIILISAFPHYPTGMVPKEFRKKALCKCNMRNIVFFRVWIPPIPHKGLAKRFLLYLSFSISAIFPLPFLEKVDIIWVTCPNYFDLLPALTYKLLKRAPVVLDVVDLWPQAMEGIKLIESHLLTKLAYLVSRFFYRVPDGITTLNMAMKGKIEELGGRAFIAENVVDTSVFKPLNVERPKDMRGKFIVMYSGNLGVVYDFDTVLMAAKSLSHNPKVLFIIRGDGEQKDYIKDKIEMLKLRNVVLDTTIMPLSEVVKCLNMADAFLLLQKERLNPESTFPIKILEYLSVKKPVIVSAKGEVAKFIEKIKAGIVVEPENPERLKDAILTLAKDPILREGLGDNGYAYVQRNFSTDTLGRRLSEIFHSIKNKNKLNVY